MRISPASARRMSDSLPSARTRTSCGPEGTIFQTLDPARTEKERSDSFRVTVFLAPRKVQEPAACVTPTCVWAAAGSRSIHEMKILMDTSYFSGEGLVRRLVGRLHGLLRRCVHHRLEGLVRLGTVGLHVCDVSVGHSLEVLPCSRILHPPAESRYDGLHALPHKQHLTV